MLWRRRLPILAISLFLAVSLFGWAYRAWWASQQPLERLFTGALEAEAKPLYSSSPDLSPFPAAGAPAAASPEELMGPVLPATRFIVPKLSLNLPTTVGDNQTPPRTKAIAWYDGTAMPGAPGNTVFFGDSAGPYQTLKYLPDIAVGDRIDIHTQRGYWKYEVTETKIVRPTEVSVLPSTGNPTLTVITGIGGRDLLTGQPLQRLVITARLTGWSTFDNQPGLLVFLSNVLE